MCLACVIILTEMPSPQSAAGTACQRCGFSRRTTWPSIWPSVGGRECSILTFCPRQTAAGSKLYQRRRSQPTNLSHGALTLSHRYRSSHPRVHGSSSLAHAATHTLGTQGSSKSNRRLSPEVLRNGLVGILLPCHPLISPFSMLYACSRTHLLVISSACRSSTSLCMCIRLQIYRLCFQLESIWSHPAALPAGPESRIRRTGG